MNDPLSMPAPAPFNPNLPTAADPFGERGGATQMPAPISQEAFAQMCSAAKAANQPAVLARVEVLEKTIAELDNAVFELIGRIKPVLTPVGPPTPQQPGCGATAPKAAQSPIGDRIDQLARAVAATTKAVNDAIKRVEV